MQFDVATIIWSMNARFLSLCLSLRLIRVKIDEITVK